MAATPPPFLSPSYYESFSPPLPSPPPPYHHPAEKPSPITIKMHLAKDSCAEKIFDSCSYPPFLNQEIFTFLQALNDALYKYKDETYNHQEVREEFRVRLINDANHNHHKIITDNLELLLTYMDNAHKRFLFLQGSTEGVSPATSAPAVSSAHTTPASITPQYSPALPPLASLSSLSSPDYIAASSPAAEPISVTSSSSAQALLPATVGFTSRQTEATTHLTTTGPSFSSSAHVQEYAATPAPLHATQVSTTAYSPSMPVATPTSSSSDGTHPTATTPEFTPPPIAKVKICFAAGSDIGSVYDEFSYPTHIDAALDRGILFCFLETALKPYEQVSYNDAVHDAVKKYIRGHKVSRFDMEQVAQALDRAYQRCKDKGLLSSFRSLPLLYDAPTLSTPHAKTSPTSNYPAVPPPAISSREVTPPYASGQPTLSPTIIPVPSVYPPSNHSTDLDTVYLPALAPRDRRSSSSAQAPTTASHGTPSTIRPTMHTTATVAYGNRHPVAVQTSPLMISPPGYHESWRDHTLSPETAPSSAETPPPYDESAVPAPDQASPIQISSAAVSPPPRPQPSAVLPRRSRAETFVLVAAVATAIVFSSAGVFLSEYLKIFDLAAHNWTPLQASPFYGVSLVAIFIAARLFQQLPQRAAVATE